MPRGAIAHREALGKAFIGVEGSAKAAAGTGANPARVTFFVEKPETFFFVGFVEL
jgi:hypothetical protein